tara:strand:+ start:405 stop:722 length:318 start_codon:yes stop_codon:yes gene_type:complete
MDAGDYFAGYEAATLEDWSVVYAGSPYTAPEDRSMSLRGKVYNHPDPTFQDGDVVTTSPVRAAEGLTVWTQRTTYNLGRVSESYLEWCSSMGIEVDLSAPVKVFS